MIFMSWILYRLIRSYAIYVRRIIGDYVIDMSEIVYTLTSYYVVYMRRIIYIHILFKIIIFHQPKKWSHLHIQITWGCLSFTKYSLSSSICKKYEAVFNLKTWDYCPFTKKRSSSIKKKIEVVSELQNYMIWGCLSCENLRSSSATKQIEVVFH